MLSNESPPPVIKCSATVLETGNGRFPYSHVCEKLKDHLPPHECLIDIHCEVKWTTETEVNSVRKTVNNE